MTLKVVFKFSIDNKAALVQIMASRRISNTPLSESMVTGTRYMWVIPLQYVNRTGTETRLYPENEDSTNAADVLYPLVTWPSAATISII